MGKKEHLLILRRHLIECLRIGRIPAKSQRAARPFERYARILHGGHDVPTRQAAAGVTAIIQPGGSVKDADSIAACDQHGIAMLVTGVRHFRH